MRDYKEQAVCLYQKARREKQVECDEFRMGNLSILLNIEGASVWIWPRHIVILTGVRKGTVYGPDGQ